MSNEELLITPGNLPDYLAAQGLIQRSGDVRVRELGGGVSNLVLLVESPDPAGRRWVVKQSLGKLRVQDDWRSDRERIFREAEALETLRPVLDPEALPEVIYVDRQNYLYVMTAAPAGSVAWKEQLLGRRADLAVARQAAALLARMINASRADPAFQKKFWDGTVFDQLRIDPYYRTTAARHPDVRERFAGLIGVPRDVESALVHGDYSPKNMLVRHQKIFLIDLEVVHWGDPAFDSAFLTNHLCLKAFHQPRFAGLYIGLAGEFWKTLLRALALSSAAARDFERRTVEHLGGLMLARIDGKSPVEYIQNEETKEQVRRAAKRILLERPTQLDEATGVVLEAIR
jgi:aminoglycoside phosphotransferase (APT) family kinase protein